MMRQVWAVAALAILISAPLAAQQRGDWVLAQWRGGEYWFPGVIESVSGNKVTINYDDGTRETRPLNQVKPYDWRVGSRIQCLWAGGSTWYAARITHMGSDGSRITVRYDDDGIVEKTRTGACRSL